jgi:hypothetical protein
MILPESLGHGQGPPPPQSGALRAMVRASTVLDSSPFGVWLQVCHQRPCPSVPWPGLLPWQYHPHSLAWRPNLTPPGQRCSLGRAETSASLSVRPHTASMEDAIASRLRRRFYAPHHDGSNTDLLLQERYEADG